ncbi:ATP11 protein-domain-containing protein [Phlyctochytrium arcticum]|nr:ATP11 protein-domain-containing protein [Phlyctochytrium arcticum]
MSVNRFARQVLSKRWLLAGSHRAIPSRSFATVLDHPFGIAPPSANQSSPLGEIWDGFLSAVREQNSAAEVYRKKYEDKLRRAAEREGAKSVEELLEKKRKRQSKPPTPPPEQGEPGSEKSPKRKAQAPRPASKFEQPPHVKRLEEIVNLDLMKPLPAKEIGDIWNKYHVGKECLSGVMQVDFFEELMERAKAFPVFVLPLPRNEGFEFFFMQFSNTQVYFTPLLEYKTRGENARPHLVLTHYADLKEEKGIVLMAGELGEPERKILTLPEAQNLVYQMQLFYVTGTQEKKDLVATFHRDPAKFDYQSVIAAIQTLG